MMRQERPDPTSPVMLDYFDPSPRRRARRGILLRVLAGTLALADIASATYAWWEHWGLNWVCVLTIVAGAGLIARATGNRRVVPCRTAWAFAAVIFGLWSFIIFINQFHGRPPPSDVYIMGCFIAACGLSGIGWVFDTHRQKSKSHQQPMNTDERR